jgi:CBS domain-containing protein
MAAIVKKIDQVSSRESILEQQLQFAKRLNNITNKIHSAKDTNDILLNLQSEILGLFAADRITIYVVDGVNKQIVSRFKTGSEVAEIRVAVNNTSISGYCAASGKTVNITNAYDNNELRRINKELAFNKSYDEKTGYRTTQVLAAPIVHNKYLLGVIQLINKKDGSHFTLEDQSSVMEIATVLGLAFFNNQKVVSKRKPTKYDFLITNNIITDKDMERAMGDARKLKKTVESVLMSDFHVSKDDIGKSLSDFYKTRFIPFDDKMIIPGQLLKDLKVNFLKHSVFVPVAQSGNKIVVTLENPDLLTARDTVKRLMPGKEFEFCVSLREDIFQMIDLFFDVKRAGAMQDTGSIEDILGQLGTTEEEGADEMERVTEEDGAIVQLVNKMIIDGFNRNA